jgi:hypothetical protein
MRVGSETWTAEAAKSSTRVLARGREYGEWKNIRRIWGKQIPDLTEKETNLYPL